jgi:DUF1680 family protein
MKRDDCQAPALTGIEACSSRRSVLKALGTGTLGAGLAAGMPGWLTAQPAPTRDAAASSAPDGSSRFDAAVRPFDLRGVRLLEGPFRDAQRRDGEYMLSLDPDRLLHDFRVNAGLEPKAPVYGGWESQQPWVDIRCQGHTLGHCLTAGSLMVAATGDERFSERIDYIVDELKACQEASGRGLVCAFPDDDATLQRAVAGLDYPGVPWYTLHKIFAGLESAYSLAATGSRSMCSSG